MRIATRVLAIALTMLALFANVAPLAARQRTGSPLEITNIRVGFPLGPQSRANMALFKYAFWVPVYVDVTCHKAYNSQASLTVEAGDYDETPTTYTVPIPQMQPGASEMIIGYARPGSRGVFFASIQSNGRNLIDPVEVNVGFGTDSDRVAVLAIGSRLEHARFPGLTVHEDSEVTRHIDSRTVVCVATSVSQLPNIWFGYDGVDVAILSTLDRDFSTRLAEEREGRKTAIVDWVRRGGQLVISVGASADLLAATEELKEILPVTIDGTADLDLPRLTWRDGETTEERLGKVAVARLKPRVDRSASVLMAGPRGADGQAEPLVVRGSCGLGRVTVVAFDLDTKAVAAWKSSKQFWDELFRRTGPRVTDVALGDESRYSMYTNRRTGGENDIRGELIRQMEDFPGVPVISFGWVALFILIYIIIVGPLDYLFLKKVVKRLELTWITFPTIVLVVSATAYYAAYALKGSELRINKYDLVDIDLASRTAVGRTWFTMFTPRIQNYRVSAEPGSPEWVPNGPPDVVTSWSGLSDNSRHSLLRRSYSYTPRATGLDGVPVQVWSTRGFESQWLSNLVSNTRLFESNLRHPPNGSGLIGSVTANLPVPLENAFLIVPGTKPEVIPLGTMVPNTPASATAHATRQFSNWMNQPILLGINVDRTVEPVPSSPGWLPTRMLFHDAGRVATADAKPSNSSFRILDQSWRLGADNPNEVILVGTLPRREGQSEDVSADPASPSRLWLGDFPESGRPRPKLEGTMRQDTCIRVILPVKLSDPPRQ